MAMSNTTVSFFERLFFKPNYLDWVLILIFSPLSFLYSFLLFLRRVFTVKQKYAVPIVSIGNLTVGGSGKTPFVIALASRYSNACIISRGYGRQSKGLVEVSFNGKILTDVFNSGDEAMLMAQSLSNTSVIVSEKRETAIALAIEKGAKVIFLDDGFNRVNIEKFEILLFPQIIKNYMTFPVGPFREFYFSKYFSHLNLYEEKDFQRVVTIKNKTSKMLLVTAISNPQRLKPFLVSSNIVGEYFLEDHAYFDEKILKEKMLSLGATSLLITQKDEVKMQDFELALSIMHLELEITEDVFREIDKYIKKVRTKVDI